MTGEKKYLRRLDIGIIIEIEVVLLDVLKPFLDQANIPYEVLDEPSGEVS
jgi:hypothetical protein